MKTELRIKHGTLLREKGKALFEAGMDYWETYQQECSSSDSVVWLQSDDGSLIVFTRGEYREELKELISSFDIS